MLGLELNHVSKREAWSMPDIQMALSMNDYYWILGTENVSIHYVDHKHIFPWLHRDRSK